MFPGPRGYSRKEMSPARARPVNAIPVGAQSGIARAGACEPNRPPPPDDRRRASTGRFRQGPALQGAGAPARPGGDRLACQDPRRPRHAPRRDRQRGPPGRLSRGSPKGDRPCRLSLSRAYPGPARPGPMDGRLLCGAPGRGHRGDDPRRGAPGGADQGGKARAPGREAVPRGACGALAKGAGPGPPLRSPCGTGRAAAKGADPHPGAGLGGLGARACGQGDPSRGREPDRTRGVQRRPGARGACRCPAPRSQRRAGGRGRGPGLLRRRWEVRRHPTPRGHRLGKDRGLPPGDPGGPGERGRGDPARPRGRPHPADGRAPSLAPRGDRARPPLRRLAQPPERGRAP